MERDYHLDIFLDMIRTTQTKFLKVFTRNKNTYKQIIEHYKWFRKIGLKYDVELISCTPNSPVNDFLKYIPLKEALKDTIKRRSKKKEDLE